MAIGLACPDSGARAQILRVDDLEGAPAEPSIVLVTFFSEFLSGLRSIAQDFERETGIALGVQGVPYLSYQTWLHARFLGKNPPDVMLLENPALAWRYGQSGLMLSFDDVIERPNPLGDDGRPWYAAFRSTHIQQSLDTSGRLYLIPYTQYGVGFFYNRSVYRRLGIEPPATWHELRRNLETVRKHGETAFVTAIKPDDAQSIWIAGMLLECLLRVHIPEVNLRTKDPDWVFDYHDRQCTVAERIDIAERVVAFGKGTIDPARAPEFAEVAQIVKDMSRTWRPDFLSLSGQDIYQIFASAGTVHMMNGTWFLGEFEALQQTMRKVAPEKVFEYGVFPFPDLTSQTTSLARAGGVNQNAGMRACLMVARQEGAEWREQAGLLLCHYLTLPRVARKVFDNAAVYDIPAVAAVPPKPEASALLPRDEFAFLGLASFAGYDAQATSDFWALWQGYLGETLDLGEFLQRLSEAHSGSLRRQSEIYRDEMDPDFIRAQLGAESEWLRR